jgi:uncharacterized membrane protein
MDTYELLLFLHFSSVIFWVGGTLLVEILAFRADRQADAATMKKLFDELNALDPVFIPATLLVLVSGVLLVIDGPWSFGALWIVLGLAGFGFIYVYGFLYLDPQVKRMQTMVEPDGGIGPQAQAILRRFFVLWRIETVVLVLVVFDMTVKPTGEDAETLLLMAAVFAIASAYSLLRARSMDFARAKADEAA